MTQKEAAARISEKTGVERKEAEAVMEALMSAVKNSMCEGKNIYLRGFGTFFIKKRARKPARIISRGEQIIIPAHNIVKFKPAPNFKKKLMKNIPVKE